jgi:Tfp pilus assembly protein PilX
MTARPDFESQKGAITLLVAIGLVILASITSIYSARSVLMDQLASHNHARASQARLAADSALASAQATLPSTGPQLQALFNAASSCPAGVVGPQWQCAQLNPAPHPSIPQAQLSATAVRDLVLSPHVVTVHANASIPSQNSQAQVRESVFVPAVAPAPGLQPSPNPQNPSGPHAALTLNGCVSAATGASLRVCPLVSSKGETCVSTAKGPAILTYFAVDTNQDKTISNTEKNACLALSVSSLPGGGSKTGPSVAVPRSPCRRVAWQSVLGDITDEQLQAWSTAQERNGLTAQTTPPRSIYWIDSPADWQQNVGTADTPVLLVFSAKACAQRCPRIGTGVRIYGSVLIDSGCNDEKMRGWQAGTIEGQLVVESGLPEWQSGTVLARPDGRNAYILNWPEGIDARQLQRVNGSWSEGSP